MRRDAARKRFGVSVCDLWMDAAICVPRQTICNQIYLTFWGLPSNSDEKAPRNFNPQLIQFPTFPFASPPTPLSGINLSPSFYLLNKAYRINQQEILLLHVHGWNKKANPLAMSSNKLFFASNFSLQFSYRYCPFWLYSGEKTFPAIDEPCHVH